MLLLHGKCGTVILIKRFLCSAVGKVYKLRIERLMLELSAPWLAK